MRSRTSRAVNCLYLLFILNYLRRALYLHECGVAMERKQVTFVINQGETSGPEVAAFEAGRLEHGVLVPLCPYSFMINKSFLSEYLPWVASLVGKSHIFIGDYWERHNIMLQDGVDERAALRKAMQYGDKVRSTIAGILDRNSLHHAFEVIDVQGVCGERPYLDILDALVEYSNSNREFQEEVLGTAKGYLIRKSPTIFMKPDSIASSSAYVFEELAFYLYANTKGWGVEVYPGADLPILRKIFGGRYAGFPIETRPRTHISCVKPR